MTQLLVCQKYCFAVVLFLSFQSFIQAQSGFTNVTAKAGISTQFLTYEGTFGGGACVFDFNNDGWEDIYITGGLADDVLYMNMHDGTFKNVFEKSGLKTKIKYVTQGAVSADINRDGWRDLFITTIIDASKKMEIPRAMNLVFINNGNNTFTDATKQFGLDTIVTFSTGAMFGDVNLDGYPDLFVGNYFEKFDGRLHVMNDNIIVSSKQFAKPLLFINQGGKYFKDETDRYGINFKGFGFGGAFTDFDNDGDLDVVVNNDFGYKAPPSRFLENKYPRKKLVDISDTMKMRLPINAMGVAVGDYNNDGWMDYYITNIRANPFMVNQGNGKPFVNRNKDLGIMFNMMDTKRGSMMPVSWGTNFADFDHDKDLDLYVANGCLNPFVTPNADYFLENLDTLFINRADSFGLADEGISRGSVVFDYDEDGDLDILVVNQKPTTDGLPDASPTLLFRNDLKKKGNWLQIKLLGKEVDLNGIGTRIEVVVGNTKMIREIDGGSSHESQSSVIAHFGVGDATVIDVINIYWMGGGKQTLKNQRANQILIIKEVPVAKWYKTVFFYMGLAALIGLMLLLLFLKKNKSIAANKL